MFVGTYTPKLDDKGRLILPAKYREALTEGLVVTKGQERCLVLFPSSTFAAKTQALMSAPMASRQARQVARMLAASAHDDQPDKQGRITIPQHLRDYAGLDRDVAVVGVLDRIEIWDAAAWSTYQQEHDEEFADLDDGATATWF